ncbi:Hypothetical protein A7982_06373 [Minicystis rosea]|nr:Hypothetical protein A7982_06373 [Minicystis rosea]
MADGGRRSVMRRTFALLATAAIAACGAPPASTTPAPPAPPPAEVRVVTDTVDAKRWLAPDAARAIAAGAGPLRVIGADILAEGERLGAFVEIPENECALAFTRASPAVSDIDLFAYDDDGSAYAADESPDREAAVLVCPPHPRRLYVIARVMSGSGVVGVGVQSVPRDAADAVAKLLGVRGRPGEDSGRLDSWPGLEAKVRAHRDALGGRWEDVRRLALPLSPRAESRVSATLDPDRCLDVFVVSSDEIASLEVVVEDARARIMARAKDRGRDRAVLLCAARSTPIHIALRPRGTQGLAAVILGRSAPGAEPELSARGQVVHVSPSVDLDTARSAVASLTASLAYAPPRAVATGQARVGSRTAVAVDLPAGCARIDVIAGKPLSELAAALWDDHGLLVAESRAGGSTPLFACGRGGPTRVEVESLESPGPFAVELRRDKAAPPALVAHPAAAARLLARLNAGGPAVDATAAASATVVSLDEGQRRSVPVPLPNGACVDVVAALDTGGSGLDLRLVDGAGEGHVTQARHVVADRVCAAPNGKPGLAEIRLLSGKAEALVLLRPVTP